MDQDKSWEGRRRSYARLSAIRQYSQNPRQCGCSIWPVADAGSVVIKVTESGRAFPSGVQHCGLVWTCPICGGYIRWGRSQLITEALSRHLEAGGGAVFGTCTVPHGIAAPLALTWEVVDEAWRAMTNVRASRALAKRLNWVGAIRSQEVTHGVNGWHPHGHFAALFDSEIGPAELERLHDVWFEPYRKAVMRKGYPSPTEAHGLVLKQVVRGELGEYLAKLQDAGPMGFEMARADLKQGRWHGRTPFELVDEFMRTSEVRFMHLFLEFEAASKGKSSIRSTPHLYERLGLHAMPADEVIASIVDAPEARAAAAFDRKTWAFIAGTHGGIADVLEAIEANGPIPAWLASYAVSHGYGSTQETA